MSSLAINASELPAEVSGNITLKAEEGDAVAVGQVVCLIDTEGSPIEVQSTSSDIKDHTPVIETSVTPEATSNYASGSPSPAAKKIIAEKKVDLVS